MAHEPPTLTLPRVAAALAVIVVLAFVVPYAVVHSLHERRLAAADADLRTITASLGDALDRASSSIPEPTQLLSGRGLPPLMEDDGWRTAPAIPLERVISDPGPDPWGNAYLINIRERRRVWAISAGPDGILQTAFSSDRPLGDDRSVPASRR